MLAKTRLINHAALCIISIVSIALLYRNIASDREIFRWSMSTAYTSLMLLGVTAVIGPIRVIAGKSIPVSIYLRRDVGIWAGIVALVHVVFGLQGHAGGKFWYYFIAPPDASYSFPLRIDPFGIASYLGLGATLVLIMLLALSNNWSVRRLGARKWKSLQRLSYAAIIMTLLHNLVFIVVAKRDLPFIVMFTAVALCFVAFQVLGYRKFSENVPG